MTHALGEGDGVSVMPPHGLAQVLATFGDIFSYLRADHALDPSWQGEHLAIVHLPFPIALSWDHSRLVERMTCHRLLQGVFEDAFQAILRSGQQSKITSFGGYFSFRPQRTGTKLSTHSWGIAVDLNPESNQQGTAGSMDPGIISIFQQAGFLWGGEWHGAARDPMHFQFCPGY